MQIKSDIEIGLSWTFKMIMLISSIWLLYTYNYVWAVNAFICFAISLIPSIISKSRRIHLPLFIDLLLGSALLAHVLGFSLKLYPTIRGYDILTHFLSSSLIAVLGFSLVFILTFHTQKIKLDLKMIVLFTIVFSMAMGVVWELYEWGLDILIFGSPHEQWGVADTMRDLLVDTIGGAVVALTGAMWIKNMPKEKLKQILNIPKLSKLLSKEF